MPSTAPHAGAAALLHTHAQYQVVAALVVAQLAQMLRGVRREGDGRGQTCTRVSDGRARERGDLFPLVQQVLGVL